MARIVPKLNLNKTPQLVDNNSLVFAKNIRLLKDGTIGPDTSLEEVETNTGDVTHNSEYHPAVTEIVTNFYYSILDFRSTTNWYRDRHIELDENEIPTRSQCFEFGVDNEDDIFDDNYRRSDNGIYVGIKANSTHTIHCYTYRAPFNINTYRDHWNSGRFSYNVNSNLLENNNGFVLLLAVRQDYYENGSAPEANAPMAFYVMIPKQYLGQTIEAFELDYILLNPVYQTRITEEVIIQEDYTETWDTYDTVKYIAQIVGLDNKIYFFKESNYIKYSDAARTTIEAEYENETFVTNPTTGRTATFDVNSKGYVTRNGVLFQDSSVAAVLFPNFNDRVKIFEYDEINNTFEIVECGWKYSGGKHIDGCCTVNNTGEVILTICENTFDNDVLVPIKHINLIKCSENDDESIYTQNPNIPITNLLFHGTYSQTIPSGVYQFFIRYEIRKDFYTGWFPCSTELFTANKNTIDTIQGSISYADLHEDSNTSFIFRVEHLYEAYCDNYEKFQIGFILSHDGGVFARSWKSFPIANSNNLLIYFDYDKECIEEINIDDLLEANYNLYNVENIASYKNKLYISNYTETDFNDNNIELYDFAQKINIDLKTKVFESETFYSLNKYDIASETINNVVYFTTYYDSQESHNIGDIYCDESWCDVNFSTVSTTPYTDTNIQVITGYYSYHEDGNGYYWTYTSNDISSMTNQVDRSYIYSLYVYDEQGNRVDLIEDNESHLTQNNVPSGLFNWRNYGSAFLQNNVKNHVISVVKPFVFGIGTDNKFYLVKTVGNTTKYIKADKIYYKASILIRNSDSGQTYTPTGSGSAMIGTVYNRYANFNRKSYEFEFDVENLYNIEYKTSVGIEEAQTLLPFTNYDFYCHFVKQDGIVTNGYKIKSIKIKHWARFTAPEIEGYILRSKTSDSKALLNDSLNGTAIYDQIVPIGSYTPNVQTVTISATELPSNAIVYPTFTPTKSIPNGYVGYFISMYKHKNNVSEAFGKIVVSNEYRLDCLECDTMLYKNYKDIIVKNWKGETVSTNARYAPSGITNPVDKFGDTGYIYFENENTLSEDKFWIIGNDYAAENYKTLVKVTPMKKGNTSHYTPNDQFLQGYFCLIKKLKHQNSSTRLYVNGSDIYQVSVYNNGIDLTLDEGRQIIDYSVNYNIRSNYNLNYISLTNDINAKIRTYNVKEQTSQETITNDNNEQEEVTVTRNIRSTQIIYSVDSLIASYITTLENTFKEYTRKLFYVKEDNKNILFNNTIRSSNIDIDETYRYIYKFNATDYYNVPTQRGVITNLIAVANTLYVHCEHSLFKFSDNKQLSANDEEVTLQENDVFNTGISEVFDAQYGYAGLQNKEQSLVTYNAYVFYDAVAKIIYAFGGEQQIGNIGEPIQKIIDWLNPEEVVFVADELNDRFFVNLRNSNGNVCLSFNFKAKSFIAIHDIDFYKGFHSRRHTYLVHTNMYDGAEIGWSIYRIIDKLTINNVDNYNAYQNCYTPSLISISDMPTPTGINAAYACIDIITNVEYEKIKVLNFINWICSEILNYGNSLNYTAEEELNRLYPGDKLRIYTDSTSTDLFELIDANGNAKLSNEQRNIDANGNSYPVKESWQYPEYNCGVFSMNYFRDTIKNGNVYTQTNHDLFKYKQAGLAGGVSSNKLVNLTERSQRENLTQENALIYGKYFVMRLIFNNRNFKVENVIFNMNNYGKTK